MIPPGSERSEIVRLCLEPSDSRDLDVAEDAASTLGARRLRVWRLVASLMQPVDLDAPRSEGAWGEAFGFSRIFEGPQVPAFW